MQSITIGQIGEILLYVASFIGAMEVMIIRLKKTFSKLVKEETKPLIHEMELVEKEVSKLKVDFDTKVVNLELRLDKGDLRDMRAEIMRMLSIVDRNGALAEHERMHLFDLKDKYNKAGGDSYVDDYFDRLRKEGKL